MDQADQELRAAIQRSWPSTRGGTPPMVDLLVPPPEETGPGKLTVGKVYGGMLILENWKLSRFGQGFNTNKSSLPVRNKLFRWSPIQTLLLKSKIKKSDLQVLFH